MLFVKFISGVTLSLDSELFSVTLSLHCSSLPPPPSDHASAFLKILFSLFMLLINSLLGKFDPFKLFKAISFLLCKSALLVVKVLNQLYNYDEILITLEELNFDGLANFRRFLDLRLRVNSLCFS